MKNGHDFHGNGWNDLALSIKPKYFLEVFVFKFSDLVQFIFRKQFFLQFLEFSKMLIQIFQMTLKKWEFKTYSKPFLQLTEPIYKKTKCNKNSIKIWDRLMFQGSFCTCKCESIHWTLLSKFHFLHHSRILHCVKAITTYKNEQVSSPTFNYYECLYCPKKKLVYLWSLHDNHNIFCKDRTSFTWDMRVGLLAKVACTFTHAVGACKQMDANAYY